ncbi:antirepressor [Salsuginibacillus kocurii]|uniref:antirepressor n=1 Tax=Salsuginibacillus kocurii TaxID=427078 RepID=UPI00037931F4|nr:antirepressor [Salsuginibacillus kocurii]
MNDVQVFSNDQFEVTARENGSEIEFDAAQIARNLGFTTVATSGNETIRWSRINNYLDEFGFRQQVTKGGYIPETYVYLLAMKANNEVAVSFQKFIAFDVLPEIRKNKVYIDPSATDQEIDHAVKFSTPQKRRKQLMEATIDGEQSIFATYDQIGEYISNWTADEKVKVLKHVELALLDKKDTYGTDIAFVAKVEELLRKVAKDIDKIRNWQNGAQKRELSKANKQLNAKLNELEPIDINQYYRLPHHPFTENSMYKPITLNKWGKSEAYRNWQMYFPYFKMPDENELDVDWDKPVKIYLAYDCLPSYDIQNFHKSAIDMIFDYYGQDDGVVSNVDIKTNKHVDSLSDGRIYFYLCNE